MPELPAGDRRMMSGCVVCVPARDEEDDLPKLLAALAKQGEDGLRVVVLANNCTDRTAEVARRFGEREPRLRLRVRELAWPEDAAHAGRARRTAMEAGAAWLREEGVDGLLLSTDADALPPPHWVRAIRRGFQAGAEVVGGELRLAEDPQNPIPRWLWEAHDRVAAYWSAVRNLGDAIDPLPYDPPPRHGDHTGASLAITLAAYEAAGGVPALPSSEDVALVQAVERNGGRVRHPPDVWVEVSAREQGRAQGGMADELRRWRRLAESGTPHLMPDAGFWHETFRRRCELRAMFRKGSFRPEGGLSGRELTVLAAGAANDIAFVAACEPRMTAAPGGETEIRRATWSLRAMVCADMAA